MKSSVRYRVGEEFHVGVWGRLRTQGAPRNAAHRNKSQLFNTHLYAISSLGERKAAPGSLEGLEYQLLRAESTTTAQECILEHL